MQREPASRGEVPCGLRLPLPELEEEVMEVLQVTGSSYPHARELPNRSGRPVSKHQKSAGGNSGSANKKLALPLNAAQKKETQLATERNKTVLLISGGKRRFISLLDYEAGRY